MCGKMSSLRFISGSDFRIQDEMQGSKDTGNCAPDQGLRSIPDPEFSRVVAEPADETRHRLEHHAGLVAVRRVPAIVRTSSLRPWTVTKEDSGLAGNSVFLNKCLGRNSIGSGHAFRA